MIVNHQLPKNKLEDIASRKVGVLRDEIIRSSILQY